MSKMGIISKVVTILVNYKQDDDILHNYTVAKATMSCDFELDSPLYECREIEDLDENGLLLPPPAPGNSPAPLAVTIA